jgi:hypothetical protein
MSASQQLEKASLQLKALADRASEVEANVTAAKTKKQAELRQQVDAAQESAKKAADDLEASASDAKDEASRSWSEVQSKWNAHVAAIRESAEGAKSSLDAKLAGRRADHAEAAAAASIDFATAALEEAEYQVLNAALARSEADDAAAAAPA